MAKPLKETLGKHVRERVASVEESIEKLRASGGASTATVAGAAVVGAAGIVAALHLLRRDKGGPAALHVVARSDHWEIIADGTDEPVAVFDTKKEAVHAARTAAAEAAPSTLVIHRVDGSVMRSHSYQPA